jgi:hypothetical protein
MLEAEGRAVHDGYLPRLAALMADHGAAELWQRVATGYAERTPSGGIHWLYRVDGPEHGNTKLARRVVDGAVQVLFETRGEGGFTVVAPSAGRTHPTGGSWQLLTGDPSSIPVLSVDERDMLHAVIRLLDNMPVDEAPIPAAARNLVGDSERPGDRYNREVTWEELLGAHGWTRQQRIGPGWAWRRPGKDHGISATTGQRADADRLYVFTTSTPFEAERPYTKFGAYAVLEHAGDHSAAASALRAAQDGPPAPPLATLVAPQTQAGTSTPAGADETPDETQEPRERTSWWRRDLQAVLAGDDSGPAPTAGRRTDGQMLFYPGLVNGLIGEAESGKTWVALHTVAQVLDGGGRVVYIDFEDTARGIVNRLRLLGVDQQAIAERLVYVEPDEQLHQLAADDLGELLDEQPDLAVLDGVNAAMQLMGLDINSNNDATAFAQKLMRPISRRGIVVLYVDHIPKNVENRAKGGIGAQAKRAMTTGCCILVEKVTEFGVGTDGKLRLVVDKDRPGAVRGASSGAKRAGTVLLEHQGGGLSMRIEPPEEMPVTADGRPRPTKLMERVSMHLWTTGEALSKARIEKEVRGDSNLIRAAVRALLDEGWITVDGEYRGSPLYRHARLFSDLVQPPSDLASARYQRDNSEVPTTSEPRSSEVTPPVGGVIGSEVASDSDPRSQRGRLQPCIACGVPVDLTITRGELRHPTCPDPSGTP